MTTPAFFFYRIHFPGLVPFGIVFYENEGLSRRLLKALIDLALRSSIGYKRF
jgi:hypothetical protein